MRASEHFHIILSSFDYVKGGSLNQGHSQGLEGYLWGGSGEELTEGGLGLEIHPPRQLLVVSLWLNH